VRALFVVHNFPPAHSAGTETYALGLARELLERGWEVHAFTSEKDISLPDLVLREREHQGVKVWELVNNLFHADFRETWDHPAVDAAFEELLERLRPDVVHVHHLMYLSAGCVEAAARRRIPVVYTLHDFWLECPRFGQLVHADGGLCATVDFGRCGTCLARFKWAQSPLERRMARAIANLRRFTGVDVGGLARGTARVWRTRPSAPPAPAPDAEPDPAWVARLAHEAETRTRSLRERVVPRVARFLAPSRFLAERMIAWGLPRARTSVLPSGVEPSFRAQARVPRGEKLRVAFLGTLVPAKGPHVLLEAWGLLPERLREKGELALHGPARQAPEYQRELADLAAVFGATVGGPLSREEVRARLAATDLLVVPSLWYENAPLVILEALASRTPLAVSDQGGMAELVEEGVGGFRFPAGDARALSGLLARLLEDPSPLERLRWPPGPPRTSADLAADVERLYRELLAPERRA
jgi:glycosyltransferase involved in cell wall biosynthesis